MMLAWESALKKVRCEEEPVPRVCITANFAPNCEQGLRSSSAAFICFPGPTWVWPGTKNPLSFPKYFGAMTSCSYFPNVRKSSCGFQAAVPKSRVVFSIDQSWGCRYSTTAIASSGLLCSLQLLVQCQALILISRSQVSKGCRCKPSMRLIWDLCNLSIFLALFSFFCS